MRMKNFFLVLFISAILISCYSTKGVVKQYAQSYFDLKRDYTNVIDKEIGKMSEYFRIAPANGPIYPLGTPLRPDTPSIITDNCKILDKIEELDMNDLPEVSSDYGFSTKFGMPKVLREVLNGLFMIEGNVNLEKDLKLKFKNLSCKIVSEEMLKKKLLTTECFESIQGQNITLVRGYIMGKQEVSSMSEKGLGANIKALEFDGLEVKYDSKGGFSVSDKDKKTIFFILCNVEVPKRNDKNQNTLGFLSFKDSGFSTDIELKFSKPSQEIIDRFSDLIENTQ